MVDESERWASMGAHQFVFGETWLQATRSIGEPGLEAGTFRQPDVAGCHGVVLLHLAAGDQQHHGSSNPGAKFAST